MTQEYITIQELCSKYNLSRITVLRVIDDLPSDQVIKIDIGGGRTQYKIYSSVTAVFDNYYAAIPKDALTIAELVKKLGIDNPRFYDFINRHGFYDKLIKTGKKVRRYQRLHVPKDVADEIISSYEKRKAERAESLAANNQKKLVPLTDYIDSCYITDDFISMVTDRLDCELKRSSIGDCWFVNKDESMGVFIEDYMRTVGFISQTEASVLLKVTRQRVAQIVYTHKSDESICIRPSMKNRKTFISLAFLNDLLDSDVNELSPDMIRLSDLAKNNNMSYKMMFKYLKDGSLKKYKWVYYYSQVEFDALPTQLKESWKIKPIAAAAQAMPALEAPIYNYLSLSDAAKELKMPNKMLKTYLSDNGYIQSEYITTRNGLPEGKQLKIDIALVDHIRNLKKK